MDKPAIGSRIKITDANLVTAFGEEVTVRMVYDSLDENWGNDGELAWPMYDEHPNAEWYAIVSTGHEGEELVVVPDEIV